MLKMVLLDTKKLPSIHCLELQQRLAKLGHLTSYVTTPAENIVERCQDAELILVHKTFLTDELIKKLTKLKYIIKLGTGYENIDIEAARNYGVKVSNLPTYGATTLAQHTWALFLELTNQTAKVSNLIKKDDRWAEINNHYRHLELDGLTLGILGFGAIAKKVIKIALAFGLKIIITGRKPHYETDLPVSFVDPETLFKTSDLISLHCSLNEATNEIINAASLAMMKPNCLLVNTSRGGLINEADLYDALLNNKISGVGLDVFHQEPVALDNPLLTLENCIVSPHNAWLSEASLKRWQDETIACVKGYLKNKLINLVN